MIQPSLRPVVGKRASARNSPDRCSSSYRTCMAQWKAGQRPVTWPTSSCASKGRWAAPVHHAHLRPDQAPRRQGGRAPRLSRRDATGQSRRWRAPLLAHLHPQPNPQPEEARMNEVKLPQERSATASRARARRSSSSTACSSTGGCGAQGDPSALRPFPLHRPRPASGLARDPDEPRRRPLPPGPRPGARGVHAALELQDVTLVANDTGGAISQITAANHRSGSGGWCSPTATRSRTPAAAFRPLQWAAKVPGIVNATLQGMRFKALRRLPIAYGWLIKQDFDAAPTREWVDPFLADRHPP